MMMGFSSRTDNESSSSKDKLIIDGVRILVVLNEKIASRRLFNEYYANY